MNPPESSSSPPPVSDDTFPRAFGPWRLERRLAVGGMAELFLATRPDGRSKAARVAIKRVLPSLLAQSEFTAMLRHEARIAAHFAHPNLVTTYAAGDLAGEPFIVLEYLRGEDVRSIVRAMRAKGIAQFPLAQAIAIVSGAAAGLGALHAHTDPHGHPLHIVHRDVSPQNVLVTFEGTVKVVDFGIAKTTRHHADETAAMRDTRALPTFTEASSDAHANNEDRTRTGKLKGKIPYMSPEQARGESLDGRSDIFSLGVILFELCTGRRLFRHADPSEAIRVITTGEYPRASETDARVWPDLEAVIDRALAPDRAHRYADARTLGADLAAVARAHDLDVSQTALGGWMHALFEPAAEPEIAPPEAFVPARVSYDDDDADWHVSVKRNDVPVTLGVVALVLGAGFAWRPHWREPPPPVAAVAQRPAMIEVHSEPEGARVDIDGIYHDNHTPDLLTALPGAEGAPVVLTLRANGYIPKPVVVPRPPTGQRTVVRVALEAVDPSMLSTLEVHTFPAGARVEIDETPLAQVTPVTVDSLQAGVSHTVRVTYPEMHDEMYTYTPVAGQTEHYSVMLRPM